MSQQISLKEAERKVFHSTANDGLWDIFLGIFFLEFVIAPFLSESMGDFWSAAIFLPVWAVAYSVIRFLRKKMVEPRIGVVKFGPTRISKMKRFSYVMLAFNVIALGLGVWAAFSVDKASGDPIPFMFSLVLLSGGGVLSGHQSSLLLRFADGVRPCSWGVAVEKWLCQPPWVAGDIWRHFRNHDPDWDVNVYPGSAQRPHPERNDRGLVRKKMR